MRSKHTDTHATSNGATELDDQALLGVVGGGSMYGGDSGGATATSANVYGPDSPPVAQPSSGQSHSAAPWAPPTPIIPHTSSHAPSAQGHGAAPWDPPTPVVPHSSGHAASSHGHSASPWPSSPSTPQTSGHAPSGQSAHAIPPLGAPATSSGSSSHWGHATSPEAAPDVPAASPAVTTPSPAGVPAAGTPPGAPSPYGDNHYETAHERFHAAMDEVHEGVHQIIEGAADIAHAVVDLLPGPGLGIHLKFHGGCQPASGTPAAAPAAPIPGASSATRRPR